MRKYCYIYLNARSYLNKSEGMSNVESLIANDDIVSLRSGFVSFKSPIGKDGEVKYIPFICQYDKTIGSIWDEFKGSYSGYKIKFVDVVTKRVYATNEYLSDYGKRKFDAGEIELGQYLTNGHCDVSSDKVVEILKSLTPQDQFLYNEGLNRLNALVHQGYKETFIKNRNEEQAKRRKIQDNDSFIDGFGRK